MEEKWYRSPEGIKQMFENYNKFDELKSALIYDGIIFEDDFGGLATSWFIEHSISSLDELFKDYEEYNSRNYTNIGHEVEGEGWMYCLYDSNIYSDDEAKKLIEKRFARKY